MTDEQPIEISGLGNLTPEESAIVLRYLGKVREECNGDQAAMVKMINEDRERYGGGKK
jgi:hypothetical protein